MKTLVISGGSSGIGAACCEKFLQNNYRVYNLDINDNPSLQKYPAYRYLKTNICNNGEISLALEDIRNREAIINTVIVSAGKHLSGSIETTDEDALLDIVNLNLLGAWRLIKQILPFMKKKGGNIITIGSDQSTVAKPNSAAYGMTKAALAQLTKSIAIDYAKYNIRANCLGVGTIDTPLYRKAIENYSQKSGISLDEIEKEEASCQPLGRIGLPQEVAELAFALSLDNLAYVTGALIPIDGGYIAR